MMTHEQLIQKIVASVDTYATDVAAPGTYTPNARRIVQELIQEAVGDPWATTTPDELREAVENLIVATYGFGPNSDLWALALKLLATNMDDLAENANE